MTDWKNMPAGRALDRVVAERLGWHLRRVEWTADSTTGRKDWLWILHTPDGKRTSAGSKDADEAWIILSNEPWIIPGNTPPTGYVFLPHFSTDLNAAWELLNDVKPYCRAVLQRVNNGLYHCWLHYSYAHLSLQSLGQEGEPAFAVATAWLAYRDELDQREASDAAMERWRHM